MQVLRYAVIILSAYLLGSVSSSVLLSRYLFHTDVRSGGSGNAGATNMARVFGILPGILVLILDAAKAGIACFIGWKLLDGTGFCLAGIFCNIGHCFPCFFGFKGGKGVSVSVMLIALIDWRMFVIVAILFILCFILTKIVSVCSILAATSVPIVAFALSLPVYDKILSVFLFALVVFQHRSNIQRILNGTEKKFSAKKG